ncbi:class II aldolase/adducin family protein [Pseudomonas typographi]|uniref:Class II aldolase/adducin family protein n=1 Tax=Pseudomonas typographi TaxID=2715964 RepID=A0ABR7YX10_9PSED|nr:class II aldolase/adducin family protein [Pseudomonas typographi]MBD1551257.1 class II aldolase/adducin family protein [Pseudomonas typographi]MBD1586249.1 class II aldolase/adducin family protein [Pseudomonas typographi]MBD1597721.1 class II aldolase/adducin family protein [Pseudomonas typographi]
MPALTAVADSQTSVRQRVSTEEWEVRVKLAAAYRLAALFRWTDHIYTHFSARVPGPEEHFLINAFGLLFDEISASNLVKVDVDGTIIDDPLGLGINQAGYVIHSAIHRARPDLKAVLHTHTRDGAAVSAQRDGLLPLSQHALIYYSRVAYHTYEGVALDLDEQQRLTASLGTGNILILRNHGLLTAGTSVEHAFRELHGLERACNIQIAAQAGGNDGLLHAPQAAIDKVREQTGPQRSGDSPAVQRHWDALIRQLDRHGQDYAL